MKWVMFFSQSPTRPHNNDSLHTETITDADLHQQLHVRVWFMAFRYHRPHLQMTQKARICESVALPGGKRLKNLLCTTRKNTWC